MGDLLSSQTALLVTMGAVTYIGLLHLWLWRWGRAEREHLWVLAWCAVSLVFQSGRLAQVVTQDPEVAVAAGHLTTAAAPLLVLTLVGFVRALGMQTHGQGRVRVLMATCLVMSVIAGTTDVFVSNTHDLRTDWFGHEHFSARAKPALALIFVVIAWALGELIASLRSSPLERGERLALAGSLFAYAACGVVSVLAAMRLTNVPMLTQYGPVLIALGLNYVLVLRHRRTQGELEQVIAGRTRALGESEERYRRLVDEAPLGVVACDREGNIIALNPYLLRLLGSPSARASTRFNLLQTPGLVQAGISAAFERCMENDRSETDEFAYTSAWGRPLRLRVHIAAVRDGAGEVSGAQAIVEDISEHVQLEARLRQSRKMEAVGQLAAGIAHEINNPMAFVRSNLTMLHQDWESMRGKLASVDLEGGLLERMQEFEELIEESLEGVERTISIVREVKEFSRSSDDAHLDADLNEIMEAAVRFATPQLARGVRVERIYGDLPPTRCSANQLQQVFLNLVINASHAVGENGSVRLVTRAEQDSVVARVEDDGCGIPHEMLERIFEPFFTTKAAGQGTGLGLYISYEIVRIHGGELRVESEPGVGTAFEVRLPCDGGRAARAQAQARTRGETGPA